MTDNLSNQYINNIHTIFRSPPLEQDERPPAGRQAGRPRARPAIHSARWATATKLKKWGSPAASKSRPGHSVSS